MKHAGGLACVLRYFRNRYKAVRDDTRSLGRDAMKAGAAMMFINIYNGTVLGFVAGLMALVFGFAIWVIGLPKDDRPRKGAP